MMNGSLDVIPLLINITVKIIGGLHHVKETVLWNDFISAVTFMQKHFIHRLLLLLLILLLLCYQDS